MPKRHRYSQSISRPTDISKLADSKVSPKLGTMSAPMRQMPDWTHIDFLPTPPRLVSDFWHPIDAFDGNGDGRWRCLGNETLQVATTYTEFDTTGSVTSELDGSLERMDPVPETVPCALTLSLHGRDCRSAEPCLRTTSKCKQQKACLNGEATSQTYVFPYLLDVQWARKDGAFYAYADRATKEFVQRHTKQGERTYQKSGRVYLRAWRGRTLENEDSCIVENIKHWWRHVPQMVAGFTTQNSSDKFSLEIQIDYGRFEVNTTPGRVVAGIRRVLTKEKQKNLRNDDFWSKKMLKALFDDATITLVIEEESHGRSRDASSPGAELDSKHIQDLIGWLSDGKTRYPLLAAAIYSRSENMVTCLHRMQNDPAFDEQQLRLDESANGFFDNTEEDIERFRKCLCGARPVNFPAPNMPRKGGRVPMKVNNNDIVPIWYPENETFGEGGYGQVYKAHIHEDYHAFSSDKKEVFALKVLEGRANFVESASAEIQAWEWLIRTPHDHIASFHTSWVQDNKFYILMPLASFGDLDVFMRNEKFDPYKDMKDVLKQLRGLASAVQHIHHIGQVHLSWPVGKDRGDRKKQVSFGYHHDLKPTNILVYSDGTWKISDFGTLRLRRAMSNPSKSDPRTYGFGRGTTTYSPPESDPPRKDGLGKEYDVWSFGCILVEVMTWMTSHSGRDEVELFRKELWGDKSSACNERRGEKRCRQHLEPPQPTAEPHVDENEAYESGRINPSSGLRRGASDDRFNFWFKCSYGNGYFRRYCVDNQLQQIKERATNQTDEHADYLMKLLVGLCTQVIKMLDPERKSRSKIAEVHSELGDLYVKAEHFCLDDTGNHPQVNDTDTCVDTVVPSHYSRSALGKPQTDLARLDDVQRQPNAKRKRSQSPTQKPGELLAGFGEIVGPSTAAQTQSIHPPPSNSSTTVQSEELFFDVPEVESSLPMHASNSAQVRSDASQPPRSSIAHPSKKARTEQLNRIATGDTTEKYMDDTAGADVAEPWSELKPFSEPAGSTDESLTMLRDEYSSTRPTHSRHSS